MKALLAVALTGCAAAAQSAHTVAPGKFEVTVAGERNSYSDQDDDDPAIYSGQVMVRTGVADNADVGLSVTRTPGTNANMWGVAVDPKFRFTKRMAQTTISLGMPITVFFGDQPATSSSNMDLGEGGFDYGGVLAAPTLYVGHMVSQTKELLIAPRLYLIKPGDGIYPDTDLRMYVGGSIGVRLWDSHYHWAVTPELGFTRFHGEDGRDGATLVTLGLGLTVGN